MVPIRKNVVNIAMKIITNQNLDKLGIPGPSSPLTDSTLNEKFSWFFDLLPTRNLAAAFLVWKHLLVYPRLSIFTSTYYNGREALHFLAVEASISITFISFTMTLEFRILLINSDKSIDQPNVTHLTQSWIMLS